MGHTTIKVLAPVLTLIIFIIAVSHDVTGLETVHILQRDNAGHLNRTHSAQRVMLGDKCAPAKNCKPGLLLPVWQPKVGSTLSVKIFRAFIYLVSMIYLFLGVSIVADRFMSAIEVITSREREVTVRLPNGESTVVLVQVWNKTVSNLTLMALGSSAPEILLSIIEICGNGFEAGDLGPGTIVGSAAFNYYGIITICIVAIPAGGTRRIERVDVFWVTLLWSVFAYVWLYLILCVFSPNVVEVWEAVSTFAFFFLTVLTAYVADRYTPALQQRILGGNRHPFHHPQIRSIAHVPSRDATVLSDKRREGNGKSAARLYNAVDAERALLDVGPSINGGGASEAELQAFHDDRRHFVRIFQQIRHEHPNMSLCEIGRLVAYRHWAEAPKSRAFRRIQATRRLTAGRSLLTSAHFATAASYALGAEEVVGVTPDANEVGVNEDPTAVVFNFQPSHYICAEDVGHVTLSVRCVRGSNVSSTTICRVRYETVEGTAKAVEDFVPAAGLLVFQPGESVKEIAIQIVDNDVYEFDEEFFVRLSDAEAVGTNGSGVPAVIGAAGEALVIVVDDDHAGQFAFRSQVERISESQGVFHLPVDRQRGARGKVIVPYTIVEGRAKRNVDFRCDDGQLIFHDHQNSATIRIEIINDDLYEKSKEFYVQLGEPIWQDPPRANATAAADHGRPILGANHRCKFVIREDEQLRGFLDRLVQQTNCSVAVGTASWKQQFQEALSVSGAVDDDEAGGKDGAGTEVVPSTCQYVMHGLSLPWKLAFAFIPPTDYLDGWVCFVVSIVLIGVLTALIGDVASMFGCTLGVKDSVTAITLVALGTSVPDTFASKLAAVQDKTADASIGNVTGSNAVNVFLGIGVAWVLASVYHTFIAGDAFHVHAGSLANSLAVFLIGCVVCTAVLQFRRHNASIGAELGGPTASKWACAAIFASMWVIYIVYSTLDAYCII